MKRCYICKKKTLTGILCICNNYYCLKHRYPNDHKCTKLNEFIQKEKDEHNKIIMSAIDKDNKVIPI